MMLEVTIEAMIKAQQRAADRHPRDADLRRTCIVSLLHRHRSPEYRAQHDLFPEMFPVKPRFDSLTEMNIRFRSLVRYDTETGLHDIFLRFYREADLVMAKLVLA